MAIQKLENQFLQIRVDDIGAQLISVYDIEKQRDVLWTGEKEWWRGHSPFLFPNVGRVKGGKVKYKSAEYNLPQHGFASHAEFEFVKEDNNLHHIFKSNEKTRTVYPFDFIVHVIHSLNGRELSIKWVVENPSDEIMLYSIGGHPGFCCTVEGEEYTDQAVCFHTDGPLYYELLAEDNKTLALGQHKLELDAQCMPLTMQTFDKDALFFLNQGITQMSLVNKMRKPYVTVKLAGFPGAGVWARPGGAPFVCLEPWYGVDDAIDATGNLEDKRLIQKLQPASAAEYEYIIQTY